MQKKQQQICFYIILAVMAIVLGFFIYHAGTVQPLAPELVRTVIIHTNDSHGRAVANESEEIMGFSAVAALKKEYEEKGDNVLVLDAGDTFHGLPFASEGEGQNIADLMNLAGYDAMTPGNHDFNYGSARLLELDKATKFPILSANIIYSSTGDTMLTPMTIIEKRGVRYGLFGLTTPEIYEKTSPDKISGLNVADPVETAELCVKKLKEANVDFIIGIMHMGTDAGSVYTSALIAESVEGIDVILDGHSHSSYPDGLMVSSTIIASAGQWLQEIGVVVIEPDRSISASLLTVDTYTFRDDEITAAADIMQREVDAQMGEILGRTITELEGEREIVRTRESNLGDWTADVIRDATGTDVVFLTAGGIRASIPQGTITKNDLLSAFPFRNAVIVTQVSGQLLLDALEHGLSVSPEPSGAFPQISGMYVEYDSTLPPGHRVMSVQIGEGLLSVNAVYTAAITDHIAAGGDGYEMFTYAEQIYEYPSLENMLLRELIRHESIYAETDGRITDISEGFTATDLDEEQDLIRD